MKKIEENCKNTTRHIANKILLLRRTKKLTQEVFAEKSGLDRRTIARAEDGIHRPSAETLEMIADAFSVPISYFYDSSSCKTDINKTSLILQINNQLNILSKSDLQKIKDFIDIIL